MRRHKLLIILGALLFGTVVYAAPSYIFQRGIMPELDNTYYLGSTSPALRWAAINLGTGTSTSAGGISAPCFYYNGGCLSTSTAGTSQVSDWVVNGNGNLTPSTTLPVYLPSRLYASGTIIVDKNLGSTANPGLYFDQANANGQIYLKGGDGNLSFARNGSRVFSIDDDQFILSQAGSIAEPILSFNQSDATGFNYPSQYNFTAVANTKEFFRVDGANSQMVFNEDSNDQDFRFESDGDSANLFSDGGANRVGVGTNTPFMKFAVQGTSTGATLYGYSTATNTANGGWDIQSGCFAVAGVCVGSGGLTGFDWVVNSSNQLTPSTTPRDVLVVGNFNASSTAIIGDHLTTSYITATSTTATSTFLGHVAIGVTSTTTCATCGLLIYGSYSPLLDLYNPSGSVFRMMSDDNTNSGWKAYEHVPTGDFGFITQYNGSQDRYELIVDNNASKTYAMTIARAALAGSQVGYIGFGNSFSGLTTYPQYLVDVNGDLSADHLIRASYFTATSTTATSTFPQFSFTTGTGTVLALDSYGELAEITTPNNPPTDKLRYYAKDDGAGNSHFFILDSGGIETDLTGGGGGCTTLSCLTDVSLGALASTSVLTYDGNTWVDNLMDFGWLSGYATSTQGGTGYSTSTIGDILYSCATDFWCKLGIGATNKYLTVSGGVPTWGDAVTLDTAQTITAPKTFSVYPEGPNTNATTSLQFIELQQLNAAITGRSAHDAVKAATSTDTGKTGTPTIDGYVTASGDRILMNSSTSTAPNGCYVTAAGAWARCTDYDAASEVTNGSYFPVINGVVNGNTIQVMTSPSVVTLGVDPITFTQLSASTVYTGSLGVQLVGNDFRTNLLSNGGLYTQGNGLGVLFDATYLSTTTVPTGYLTIKNLGITNAKIANSTIDVTTKITGVVPVANGGTNLSASTDDNVMVGNGVTWQSKGMTDCDSTNNAVTYDTTLNAFGCNSISGGGGGASLTIATTSSKVTIFGIPNSNGTTRQWTNMPAAAAEFFEVASATSTVTNGLHNRFDSTYANAYRISLHQGTAGFAGADLNLQCSSADSGAVWYAANNVVGNGEVDVGTGANQKKTGTIGYLNSNCLGDRFWRIVGKQGNGTVDPTFAWVEVEFYFPTGGGFNYDWNKQTNYGVLSLTPTTTIPVWFKDQVFASSSAIIAGNVKADTFTATNTAGTSDLKLLTATNATTTGSLYVTNNLDLGGFTTGNVLFTKNSTKVANSTNLFWDNTNARFGIGSSTPTADLTVDLTAGSSHPLVWVGFSLSSSIPFFTVNYDGINGLVGVATATPFKTLSVAGNVAANDYFAFTANGTSTFQNGVFNGSVNYGIDTASNDTYVTTITGINKYTPGLVVYLVPKTANTGAASLNINSLGAQTIVKRAGVTLANNDILAFSAIQLIYGTSTFQILNPIVP